MEKDRLVLRRGPGPTGRGPEGPGSAPSGWPEAVALPLGSKRWSGEIGELPLGGERWTMELENDCCPSAAGGRAVALEFGAARQRTVEE